MLFQRNLSKYCLNFGSVIQINIQVKKYSMKIDMSWDKIEKKAVGEEENGTRQAKNRQSFKRSKEKKTFRPVMEISLSLKLIQSYYICLNLKRKRCEKQQNQNNVFSISLFVFAWNAIESFRFSFQFILIYTAVMWMPCSKTIQTINRNTFSIFRNSIQPWKWNSSIQSTINNHRND